MKYKINFNANLNIDDNSSSYDIKVLKEEIQKLNNLFLESEEKVSYYYEDINTGSIISYNSDILFYAASTIKILVCIMILELAENGKINLNKKLLIKKEDLKQDTGIIKFQEEDTYYTIKELIRLTIVESDNTAYIKLVNYIGKEKLKEYGLSLGAKHTMEGKDLFGLINANDMIIYLRKLKTFIDNSIYGSKFKEWLSNPSFSIIEKENIGNNIFVKKYGSYDIAYHEVGYVNDANPFYLIILTQKFKCNDKEQFVNNTAKIIYKIHKLIHNKLN